MKPGATSRRTMQNEKPPFKRSTTKEPPLLEAMNAKREAAILGPETRRLAPNEEHVVVRLSCSNA